MKEHTEFDEMVAEFEKEFPEEMEAARIWAADFIQRFKNGEKVFEISPVVFTDKGKDV